MFAAVAALITTVEGAYLPACVSLRSPCLPYRSAAVLLQASNFDGLIDELLAAPEEQVLSVMGQRLETIADSGFMAQLERRRAAAGSAAEEQALELLGGSVCDFMEELVQRMQAARNPPAARRLLRLLHPPAAPPRTIHALHSSQEVAPELQEQEARAQASVAQAAQAAQAAEAAKAATAAQVALWSQMGKQPASGPPQPAKRATRGAVDPRVDEALRREQRAKNRFKVENLLDAANAGVEALDLRLREMRGELNEGFFEHLRWEVEQQVAAKNEKVLGILELIIQRACVEAEAGHPEVELLAALLQTRNRELRQEMYQRRLATADQMVRRAFGESVQQTQLRIEKDLLAGNEVDRDLLQQLRVIALEMQPFLKLDE